MAIRTVLIYPDKRLRNVAKAVQAITPEIKSLVSDMFETMYHDNGVGLAATQINVAHRIITIDVSEDRARPLTLINPEIVGREGTSDISEGCLSLPGVYEHLGRAERISFKTMTLDGGEEIIEAEGLLSVCVQHEIDHLDGVLMVDHLSRIKRERTINKLKKLKKRLM